MIKNKRLTTNAAKSSFLERITANTDANQTTRNMVKIGGTDRTDEIDRMIRKKINSAIMTLAKSKVFAFFWYISQKLAFFPPHFHTPLVYRSLTTLIYLSSIPKHCATFCASFLWTLALLHPVPPRTRSCATRIKATYIRSSLLHISILIMQNMPNETSY